MHHANNVRNVVVGIHEDLQQEKTQEETPASMQAPVDHVANTVQSTQQQLASHLQKIQSIVKIIQMHYNAVPHVKRQDYGKLQDYVGRE